MKNNQVVHSLGHAILAFLYIALVAGFMSHIETFFDNQKPDTFVAPLFMILLFVLSATIVGTLVLARPILLYLDGRKPEALKFFGFTLLWLLILTLSVFFTLLR
ncbi:MAG: hypothetical protein AAB589_02995 [Patescibacteria group bacterium]